MTFSKNRRPVRKSSGPAASASGGMAGGKSSARPGARKPNKRVISKAPRKPSDKAAIPNIENTGREAGYLDQLIRQETPVAVVLKNGEIWRGYIRYYDRDVFSIGPLDGGPKIFLRKESVRYLYETE
jgi:hypothetical protein